MNTEILISSQDGSALALLRPTDASMTAFTSTLLIATGAAGGSGKGLAFGSSNTFWADGGSGSPLVQYSYDASAGTATLLQSFGGTTFPEKNVQLGVLPSSNLLVALSMESEADVVKLYDISDPAAPVLLDRELYAVNKSNTGPYPGAVSFGNGRVYTLDANNGVMAYTIAQSTDLLAPEFFLVPGGLSAKVGGQVALKAGADANPSAQYQWQFEGVDLPGETGSTLTLTNVQITNSGTYTIVASNSVGSTSQTVLVRVLLDGLVTYEPFDYPVGENLVNQTNAQSQSWTQPGTTPSDTFIFDDNLTVSGLPAPTGHSVTNGGAGAEIRFVQGTNVTSGTLYYSIAFRMDEYGDAFVEDPAAPKYMFTFLKTSGNSRVTRVVPRPVTNEVGSITGYQLGLVKVGNATVPVYDDRVFNLGPVVFVVGSYTFDSVNGDTSKLWINPDVSTFGADSEPAPSLTMQTTSTLASIDRFALISATTLPARYTLDELRIGFTWGAVTPPGEQAPKVNVSRSGNEISLSWTSSDSGFILEGATSLDSGTWTPISYEVDGTSCSASVAITGQSQFFRLRK